MPRDPAIERDKASSGMAGEGVEGYKSEGRVEARRKRDPDSVESEGRNFFARIIKLTSSHPLSPSSRVPPTSSVAYSRCASPEGRNNRERQI